MHESGRRSAERAFPATCYSQQIERDEEARLRGAESRLCSLSHGAQPDGSRKLGKLKTEQRAGRKPWVVLAQPLPSPRTSASSSAGGGRAGFGSQGGCEGRRKVKCGLRLLGAAGTEPPVGTCSSRSRGRKPKIEVMSRSLSQEAPVLVR